MIASLVVITYNQAECLRELIDSINSQITEHNFETVIVNDCSTDQTGEYLSSLPAIENLIVINSERNLGRAGARNLGAKNASGDILIFVDGDLKLSQRFVQNHVGFHRQHKENSAAIGKVIYSHQDAFSRYLQSRGAARNPDTERVPFRYFVSWNFSLPRSLFERLNGFDINFLTEHHNVGEDLEFGYRLHHAGCRIAYLPSALAEHITKPSLEIMLEKRYKLGLEGLPLFMEKHPRAGKEIPVYKIFATSPLIRFTLQIALHPIIYNPLRKLAKGGIGLPGIAYEYLIHGAVLKGLWDSSKLTRIIHKTD